MPSMAQMEPAEFAEANQGEPHLSGLLYLSYPFRYHSSDVCQSR